MKFDYDFIEMPGNRYFKFSSRRIVSCPFEENEIDVVSARAFKTVPAGGDYDGGFFC